jgi:hypothetical protein
MIVALIACPLGNEYGLVRHRLRVLGAGGSERLALSATAAEFLAQMQRGSLKPEAAIKQFQAALDLQGRDLLEPEEATQLLEVESHMVEWVTSPDIALSWTEIMDEVIPAFFKAVSRAPGGS